MCQILLLTNAEKLKNKITAVHTIAEELLATQRDGFGYAIHGKKGIFGERTNQSEFKTRLRQSPKSILNDSFIEPTHNIFGTPDLWTGGAMFHGRTSTNSTDLTNAHPLQKNNWTLIHNGVVNNRGPSYTKMTSNDTEHILHWLSTEGMASVEKYISGYYACAAFDPQGNLHVFKDGNATLHVAKNLTLGCLIFGTTAQLIENISERCHWKIGPIEKVKSNIHLIFNPAGDLIHTATIKPLGYTTLESDFSARSLGYKLVSDLNQWRSEVKHADASYKFYDWNAREMTHEEFKMLDEVTKLDCTVVRSDGTVVDAEDYYKEKLA